MTMVFLDPNLYCYTEEEWAGGDALDRIEALLEMLADIDEAERALEANTGVSFLLPEEILLHSYETNPNINNPPNNHYFRLFKSRIMPGLERRKGHLKIEDSCDRTLSDHITPDSCVAPQALNTFLDAVSCSEVKHIVYAYHPQRPSLHRGSEIFADEVAISSVRGRYFVNHIYVYPLSKKKNPETALNKAISILHCRMAFKDPAWLDFRLSNVILHADFIQSVERADFRTYHAEYRERILYAIMQVASARDVTTNEHTMIGHKVRYCNQDHQKWNAYVFQMGPNSQDARCSRLYFSKINGGVLLFYYDPDAH